MTPLTHQIQREECNDLIHCRLKTDGTYLEDMSYYKNSENKKKETNIKI